MSISFSGLASGLDTTSWVESLVALKRAKVTTLQEEKEELLVSKDTLSSIKNFFNSFRSTIERITDSRFNIVSMDLFAQNIATSANLSVLTATASSEAEEGSYKVKVDKLASNTTATSNYKKTTTTTVTATATEDTLLTNIGVKTGNIGVTVNGIKHGIAITEKDTIGTFIDKLENIGVEASFNKNTGVFSMNISAGDIDDDIDNDGNNDTEIVEKLHLAGVNEGYKTQNKLEVEKVETVWKEASASTKLIDLGVKAGTITIEANDSLYDVTINDETTIEQFVQALNTNHINATYDETTGIFTLNDAEITNEGDTEIIRAFGLQSTVYSKSQVSGNLSLETVVTTTTSANSATFLKDLGDGISITDGDTVVVKNSNNKYTTITVGEATTIGGLLAEISNAGLYAAINNDGTVEISGGVIEGGSFDAVNALGLSTKPFTAMVTGSSLTETTIEYKIVDLQTRLVEDLGVTRGYLEVTDADGNKFYEKIYSGQTIADFMADMGNLGIYTKLDEETGVLEITGGAFRTLDNLSDEVGSLITNGTIVENDDTYKQGTNLLECLYGSDVISTDQISVSSTYSRTRALTTSVSNLQNADLTTTLELLGLTTEGTAIFDSHGSEITIDITKDMTIQALREKLSDNGISTEWDAVNSKLTINNATLVGGTSDLGYILNLTEVISGKYVNSDAIYTTTYQTIFAEPSTPLTELGLKIDNNMVYTSYTIDGTIDASGVSGTVIGISSATDLQNLANLVNAGNTMSGKTFVLTNDIDMSSIENFAGIGESESKSFQGTFDGQGYTISNLKMSETITASGTKGFVGLFAVASNATFKNVTISNANISLQNNYGSPATSSGRVGTLVGHGWGNTYDGITIENTNINITGGNTSVGGLCGTAYGCDTIKNCSTTGTISGAGTEAGGIIGWVYTDPSAPTIIDSCQNAINIASIMAAGGIVGYIDMAGNATISNCYNKGSISSNGTYSAGIIGCVMNTESNPCVINVRDCYNSGEISGYSLTSNTLNFGIFRSNGSTLSSVNITNCFGASTDITGTTYTTKTHGSYATQWSSISISTTGCENDLTPEQVCEKAVTAGWDTNKWALSPTNINLKMASEEVILHKEDGTTYTLNVDSTTTLQDLVDQINYYGVTASISGGKFQIENGYITNEALENALGLETKITGESVVLGTQLTHTITEGATGESTLGEIIETLGATAESKVASGYNLSFKGTTLTVDENTTLNNLFEQISNAGGRAFLDSTGRIHIEGGTLTGSVAEALGFTTQNITTAVSASGETITMTATVVADYTSRVGDFTNVYNIDGEITVDGVTGTIIGISTAEELALLATHVNNGSSMAGKTFVLTDDIDLSGYEDWTPIGYSDSNNCWFTGTFDGNGHTISNLNQEAHQDPNITDKNYTGLFGVAVNATFKNLKLDNINIIDNDATSATYYAGVLLGVGNNITLENIEVTNLNMQLTTHAGYIGGVAGRILNDSHFNNIKADGTIVQTGSAGAVGGLFGELYLISDAVQYCYSSVDITANSSYAGGIAAGLSTNNTIAAQYCLNNGTIHNNDWHTGGIFGLLNLNTTATTTTNVEDCYNLGSLSSADATTPVADVFTRCNMTTGTINVKNCGGIYGEAYKATNGTTINVSEFITNVNDIYNKTAADKENWYMSSSPIPTKADICIRNSSGDIIGRIENVEDMTFEELFNRLNSYGINASFENGVITMTSEYGNYITGTVAEALGITTTSTTETTTIGMTNTSSVAITYTQTVYADETTNIEDLRHLTKAQAVAQGYTWVTTAAELTSALTTNDSSVKVMLGDDISLAGIDWTTIGTDANPFKGELNGNGYYIDDLNSTQGGFFGYLDGAVIQNITFDNASSVSPEGVRSGVIAAFAQNSAFYNCRVTNSFIQSDNYYAGAIVGVALDCKIENCVSAFNKIESIGDDDFMSSAGGFCGEIDRSTIKNSSTYGNEIFSIGQSGGIAGLSYSSNFEGCNISSNSITGEVYQGIFVGESSNNTFKNIIYDNSSTNLTDYIGSSYYYSDFTNIKEGVVYYNDPESINIFNKNNELIDQVNLYEYANANGNPNIGHLISCLSEYGISASINNGIISLTSADGNYITGSIAEELGIEVMESVSTVTGGKTFQSTMAVTFTETSVVDTTTTLEDLKHMSEAQAVAQGYTWVTNRTDLWNALNTSNENTKIMLGCDIDLAGEEWAKLERKFRGELNGNNYTIKNLTQTNVQYGGLISETFNSTVIIKNLNIDEANITSTSYSGAIIGFCSGTANIENCTVTNSSILSTNSDAGGLIGNTSSVSTVLINNTSVSNNSLTARCSGGLIGYNRSKYTVINNSKIYSNNLVCSDSSGGILGGSADYSSVSAKNTEIYIDCEVNGLIGGSVANITLENVTYQDEYGVGALYGSIKTGGTVTETNVVAGEIDPNSGIYNLLEIYNSNNELIATHKLDNSSNVGDVFSTLAGYGISGSINNGVITLDSTNGNYIKGNVAERLGIGTQEVIVTTTVGTTATSTASILYTEEVVADYNSKVSEYINRYEIDGTIDASGVTGNVIGISTAEELALLATHVNNGSSMAGKTFVLTDDIDLSGYENWTPIGNDNASARFKGTFDGQGYTISNLTQTQLASDSSDNGLGGLFGIANQATIKNLKLDNVHIEDTDDSNSWYHVGALLSYGRGITIENIEVTNLYMNINATDEYGNLGGVVGVAKETTDNTLQSTINNVKASGTINHTGTIKHIGGIAGMIGTDDPLMYLYSMVNISAEDAEFTGGLIGGLHSYNTTVAQFCANQGNISSNIAAGGLLGVLSISSSEATIANCYSTRNVNAPRNGQILGYFNEPSGNALYLISCGGKTSYAAAGSNGGTINTSSYVTGTSNHIIGSSVCAGIGNWQDGIPDPADIIIKDSAGDFVYYFEIDNMTFKELFDELKYLGINCTMTDGQISVESTNGNYVTGEVWEALGFEEVITTTTTTTTTPVQITSTAAVTYTATTTVTGSETLGSIENKYGTVFGTLTSTSITGTIIKVSTAQDLVNLASAVNSGASTTGKTFILTGDIDMSSITDFAGIGNDTYAFKGTFDGQGYTISNLKISETITSSSTRGYAGLFTYATLATFKNLTISGAVINLQNNNTGNAAGRVGTLVACGDRCTFDGISIKNTNISIGGGNTSVGGLAGMIDHYNTIKNCSTTGTISGVSTETGGLVGWLGVNSVNTVIDNCNNSIKVTGKNYSGGIIGYISTGSASAVTNITNCLNKGNVTSTTSFAAGIVGTVNTGSGDFSLNISDSINLGSITGNNSSQVNIARITNNNGIPSGTQGITINNCFAGQPPATNTDQIYRSDAYHSFIVDTTGTEVGLTWASICQKAITADYDTTKWSLNTSNISLKTGDEYDIWICDENGVVRQALNLNSTSVLGGIYGTLRSHGTANIADGQLIFVPNADVTIDGGGQKFLNTKLTKTVTQTMNSDTTFRELGLSGNYSITIRNSSTGTTNYTISIRGEHTVGDLMTELASYGFDCSIRTGNLTIKPTGSDYYIYSANTTLESKLKIDFASNKSYTITTSTTTTYTTSTESDRLIDDSRYYIDSDTTFGDLGCPEGASKAMTVYSNGETHTISVTSSKTLGEFMTELASYGITTEISEDGKFTFKADNDAYVKTMAIEIAQYLKFYDIPRETIVSTTYANTTSASTLQTETTSTLNSSTTFSNLGITGAKEIEVVSNGSAYTVTVNPDQTLGDLMTTLAGYGIVSSINDGKLIIQGNGENFVSSIDTDLSDILQIEEIVYPDIITTTFTNTTSDEFKSTEQRTLSSSTTIGSLHEGETWYSQYIYLTRPDGIQTRFEVYDSDTIDDIITQLAGYGIRCDIYNGYFSINNEASNSYIIDMNPELKDALGLSNTFYTATVTTTTTNDNSNKLSATTTTTATGATQLIDLRDEHGNAPTDYQINISTVSQEGSFNTVLTFNTTDTLHDVIDKLAEYGINATIDSAGRFDISSNTLTDFEISGGLGEFLMSDSYIKKYQESSVSNTSTILPAQTEEFMNDSTILGELGIYSGDVVVYKNGEKFTISVSTPQSVGDFRAQLGEYGISSSIIEGKLQLIANGVVYLETPDSNASNLVEVMGLGQDKWTKGDYSQKSDDLSVVNTINATATLDSKIKDLTDENGNPLGITNGQIYVYQDGVRNIIDINTNDTLRTLANKLKNYGITVGMSQDGHLYFDGNNNSYLTTEGLTSDVASNILTKFNISGEWNTRYDSVSEKLDYEIEGESVADGSTKLVDLQDEDGNSLGITTGTYYVYQNGVRNTETITSDTTVNDFRATMASYGLTTDFNENGELSVGGYNETYLATSALAGDNTNAIDVLFEQWNFVNVYTSNGLDVPENVTVGISETTKLADINEGTYQAGYITVVKDGVKTNIELTENDTVGDLIDELALYGFESVINSNGQLIIKNTGNSTLENYSVEAQRSNALELLGIGVSNWINTNTYEGSPLSVTETTTKTVSATRETLLSDLNLGITTGEYYIYNNGVKYTALISSDETIGSLMDTLASFGIQANLVNNGTNSVISIIGNGDSYVAKSNSTTNASNIVEKLFVAGNDNTNYSYVSEAKKHNELVTSNVAATEFVLLSEFDNIADPTNQKKAQGDLIINIGGTDNTIQITATETIGSLITKLQDLGLNATLSDGTIIISSNFDTITINSASTSKLLETINLQYQTDLGGYVSSNATVIDTQTIIEDKTLSVANYANDGTEMKLLNISSGSLTVYRNGEKATIQIDENQTFGDLNSLISARFSDVKLGFEDGYLRIYSDSDDVSVEVGSTTDTSNFSAITGIASDGNGDTKSSRELYCVNSNSVITTSGLFRNGDVTEGTFKIGDATFEITNTTRLSDLISQINASQDANATAYWDSIDGKFVIQSRTTGAALINIEADSSNFTDIMGLTTSGMEDTDGDGTDDKFITRINTETQKIGDNAKFSINGTYYTSTKNDIGSDVSRINGLTINLKGISEGETTITVERDKETVANAVSDVVDAYNELIENIDKEIAKGKPLADQSTLKLIRNQIRSVMTGALVGASTFKNLDAIGISIEKAAANNINTANINVLNFDKDKFIKAFDADRDALKTLLVGTESNNGIFQQVENIIEQAVTTGYFTSAERSYNNQISRLDDKIEKAQKAVERYKEQLEAKFASMDLLISKMQNQYSSFLGL